MQLFALGLNHRSAPLALRERVAFTEESLARALAELAASKPALECAIVSTCNRTELYAADGEPAQLLEWLAAFHRVRADEFAPHLYTHTQLDAVRHAFRVASGLDSMVLGEPQILGQMKDAVRAAEDAGALGTTLHKLFQRSFGVAKDVRTNTKVGANVVSMAAAAVKLALRIFPTLTDRRVLFIGAGEMIELAATHFAAQTPRSITVANRTPERGQALAQRFGGESIALRNLAEHLADFDVVVSSTAASLPIIGKGLMERIVRSRKHEPIVMVDLAVPRDIEPEVGELDDVFLYTIDDLAALVAAGSQERLAAVGEAEAIIDTEVTQFREWMHARNAVPLIRVLRDRAEAARQAELERALKMLARGDDPRGVLEALSQALTNKLMHAPTQALNDAASVGTSDRTKVDDAADLQDAIARLFRLRADR